MSAPQQLTPLGSALAGALGACFSNAVVYPLDVAKTRIQATNGRSNAKALSMYALLLRILREEGVAGYFKGFGATMLNTFSQQYAYFFFYSLVRGTYTRRLARNSKNSKAPILSTAAELALGALAGALAQIFTIPVSVIATRQQLGRSISSREKKGEFAVDAAATAERKSGVSYADAASVPPAPSSAVVDAEKVAQASLSIPPSYTDPLGLPTSPKDNHEEAEDDSFLGVARAIIKEEGPTGLWLGLRPGLVLTVNPAITYGAFERLKSGLLVPGTKLSPGMAFMLGAFSKTLATIVTYPYIMAKVRIQTRTKGKENDQVLPSHHGKSPASEGALDILQRVYREEGPVGWYRGMGAQITKAVLSQGVLFMSKDQFERWALILMAALYRMQRARA